MWGRHVKIIQFYVAVISLQVAKKIQNIVESSHTVLVLSTAHTPFHFSAFHELLTGFVRNKN